MILYAIYKNGEHKGNIRAENKQLAMIYYLRVAMLPINCKNYKSYIAIKNKHY